MLERAVIAEFTDDEGKPLLDPAVRVTTGTVGPPSSSGRPSPTTPEAALQDQAALRVLALRGARARSAYRVKELPWPVVRLSRMNTSRTWAFGSAVIPTPAGVNALPDSALFLAKATGEGSSGWTVELAGTSGFSRLLGTAPTSVVPTAELGPLRRYGSAAGGGTGARPYGTTQPGEVPRTGTLRAAVSGGFGVKPSPGPGAKTPKSTPSSKTLAPAKSPGCRVNCPCASTVVRTGRWSPRATGGCTVCAPTSRTVD
jgi:hypothetical protein